MQSDSWQAYEDMVNRQRYQVYIANTELWEMLAKCECKNTRHKVNKHFVNKKRTIETHFDECVVCLKIHNIISKVV
jgi:hypothetical protein